MKVSDPIIFGHAVRVFFADVFAKHGDALAAAGVNPNNGLGDVLARDRVAARPTSRPPSRPTIAGRHRRRPAPRDGRLRPRHHQPARAERRHRRRLDAGHDPHLRPDVERRGRASRTPWPSSPTRATPASTRSSSTSAASTARSTPSTMGSVPNVGLMAQTGRGVRLARQDLRDPRRRHRARGRRRRQRAHGARRRGRRHLAHVPGQGRCRSTTG